MSTVGPLKQCIDWSFWGVGSIGPTCRRRRRVTLIDRQEQRLIHLPKSNRADTRMHNPAAPPYPCIIYLGRGPFFRRHRPVGKCFARRWIISLAGKEQEIRTPKPSTTANGRDLPQPVPFSASRNKGYSLYVSFISPILVFLKCYSLLEALG